MTTGSNDIENKMRVHNIKTFSIAKYINLLTFMIFSVTVFQFSGCELEVCFVKHTKIYHITPK